MSFNAEQYWSTRKFKKWVVRVSNSRGCHTKYVGAQTRERAIESAKANTLLPGKKYVVSARLATPSDLGCSERVA